MNAITNAIQRLELVDSRFPALFTGEKRDTVRWNEGCIELGYLLYYASVNSKWKTLVWVTATRNIPLNELAEHYKQTPEELLGAMQRHYPHIQIDTEVLFVEHLTPQETFAVHGIPEDFHEQLVLSEADL